jgi:hypothetical protein
MEPDLYEDIYEGYVAQDPALLNEVEPEEASHSDEHAGRLENEDDIVGHEDDLAIGVAQLRLQATVAIVNEQEAEVFTRTEEDNLADVESRIENVRLAQQFIQEISCATLDGGKLDEDVVSRIRNPIQEPVDISDPDERLSLDLFIATRNASEATYHDVRTAIKRRSPGIEVLSHHLVKKLVAEISGVVSVRDDMCINSCHAFTGPFTNRTTCLECGESRYDTSGKPKPRQQACTIPLGPQIQALRRSQNNALAMHYRDQKTRDILNSQGDPIYEDIFSGYDFLEFAERVQLGPNDTTVSLSLDGAQLYQNKKSDTWIAVWIINDYDPITRYKKKHVLPALVIPGPNKPKNIDSFLFRSFHHLSALQHENEGRGMYVWDGSSKEVILSRIMFMFGTADAMGLTEIDGRVGHHGAQGCRMSCDMKGRHKPNSGHYYAAHLCPNECVIPDSNHPDYDFRAIPNPPSVEKYNANLTEIINSSNQTDYEKNRKLTGLSKPSILSALNPAMSFPVPRCFTIDLMHLLFINLGELLIPLWRGILPCDPSDDKGTWDWATLTGNTWLAHGKLVAAATRYFPLSFHRPPRNPAEKISSGYKATEYFLYVFGLGPAFFRTVLPSKYWENFCKLVHGVRIITQRQISTAQVREAHSYLTQFVEEYENLYYQRRMDQIHFCRPCLHTLLHAAAETTRVGPRTYLTQFTMERAIGDLGGNIRQPSNIYGNLCQIALRQSQLNAMKSLCPELDPDLAPSLPAYSMPLADGYVLLRPRDRYVFTATGSQGEKIYDAIGRNTIRRWGRLQLPNGQLARSAYKEDGSTRLNQRVSRNVRVGISISSRDN